MFRFFNLSNFKYLKYLPSYIFDSEVSLTEKAEILVVLIYIISPFDLIPEFLVGFGNS